MKKEFQNKIILITGGTGTIGSGLVKELLKYKPKQIRVLSRDESKQYELLEKLDHPVNLRLLIGDIRDQERLKTAFRDVDIVFHAAAMKHVPFCEYNPFEAVKTNIMGSQNIINAALENKVKKVIAISTDKVVHPTNIMGISKLMMERLFINANQSKGTIPTHFSCVRFGNVSWARGSVLPLWKAQVEKDMSIRVTNPKMTRFLMSIQEAVDLVLEAAVLSHGGEIFIFKMPAIELGQLAKLFIKKYFSDQKVATLNIGARDGEKMHEQLIGEENTNVKVLESKKMIILIPQLLIYSLAGQETGKYPGFRLLKSIKPFISKNHVNTKQILKII